MGGPLMLLIVIVAAAGFFGFTQTGKDMVASIKNRLKGGNGNGNGNGNGEEAPAAPVVPVGYPQGGSAEGRTYTGPEVEMMLGDYVYQVATDKNLREQIRDMYEGKNGDDDDDDDDDDDNRRRYYKV